MLDGAMLVWFVLGLGSLAFVIWDSITNAPTSWVQRVAWILVVVYTGVVGLVLYLLACRRPFPGAHDAFTRPVWKQGVNSEMHCLAGDATGIVVAAAIVPAFGLANGWDVTIEYLAGFICGLFIFQALMMVGMYDGNYFKAVRKTFFSETVSMNMVMAGMIPTMVVLTSLWPESESPLSPAFWFRMGLATIVGGVIAFPVNWWLVANHLKHGCMTLPGKDTPAPCLGHCSMECQTQSPAQAKPEPAMAMNMDMPHEGHMHEGHKENMPMHDDAMGGMHHGDSHGDEMHDGDMHSGHSAGGHEGHHMMMRELPLPIATAWVVSTFVVLLLAIYITNLYVPIRFTE